MPKAPNLVFTFRFDHMVTLELSKLKPLRVFGRPDIQEQIQWSYKLSVMGEVLFEGADVVIAADVCATAGEAASLVMFELTREVNFDEPNRRQKLWFDNAANHYAEMVKDEESLVQYQV